MNDPVSTSAHSVTKQAPDSTSQRLEHLPVVVFAMVLGTTGLALAWLKAHAVLGMPLIVGIGLRGVASALFVVVLAFYTLKALRYPRAIQREINNPMRICFFPMISISVLLLASAYLETEPQLAFWLWSGGTLLHLCFTLAIFGSWIYQTHYEIKHVSPAWLVPVVGNILVPLAGVKFGPPELSWFFFSVGLVFWLVLLTIILYRLIFHGPLPERLMPTLFILLAPPSVGFIAYSQLSGEINEFGRILYYVALFFGLLLASHAILFFRLPFFISSWAYSFPMAALTLATLRMSSYMDTPGFTLLATELLALISLLIAALAIRTLIAIWRREICRPE